MRKLIALTLIALMLIGTAACSAPAQTPAEPAAPAAQTKTLTGVGKGFGGEVTVTVTVEGDKIVDVKAVGDKETKNIGSKAIDELPAKIVEAGSVNVDVVTGATVTSNAIIYAVNNALDPATYPAPVEEAPVAEGPATIAAAEVYMGFGLNNTPRVGPGKDDTDVPVYSVNQVFANVLFDGEGKILNLYIDQLEYATPNYDGESMPHFSGFPGQGGYNNDENHDAKVDGKTADTEENFVAEVNSWATKRDRGDSYVMNTGTWSKQMDTYQKLFVGKTVEEVEAWFAKYTSDLNGRPLKADGDKPEDQAKYGALTEEEKAQLADVVSTATMSLKDPHGNILAAIKNAYENRVPLAITSAAAVGFGLNNTPRIGPGKDDTDVPVYSINQVFANTLFDADGKILAIYIDQLEYATPNYDGESMPHFSGFPGQGGYNNDENHDAKVDGKTADTEENFIAEVNSWATKRDRGDSYVMNTGTWTKQMDTYQQLFVGKTVEEVEAWFAKYTSDLNGRPLKADGDKPEDQAKYGALTEEEKAQLADVVSTATMSLNDPHGNILAAIKASFDKRQEIVLSVG